VEYPHITDKGTFTMSGIQDGTWEFDDTGLIYNNDIIGRFSGWCIVGDGDIAEVWVEVGPKSWRLMAPGSWIYNSLTAALAADLPAYIAYQASSKRHWREAAEFQNAKTLAVTP
jgi:hypothetical protein